MYVENPFCDFVIGILWLGIKSLPRPLRTNGHWPKGSKGGEYLCTHERIWTLVSFSDNFCKILANLSPPLSGRLGGASFFTYLSVTQIDTMVFAELVTLAYWKTMVIRKILLTFANRERKRSDTLYHPTSTFRLFT